MKNNCAIDIDFETRSLLDIKRVPAHKYAEHESTQMYMLAVNWNEGLTQTDHWNELDGVHKLRGIIARIKREMRKGRRIRAHNQNFEFWVWNLTCRRQFKFFNEITLDNIECTAAMSRVHGLGRSLDQPPTALGLDVNKDKENQQNMLFFSKPYKGEFRNPEEHLGRYGKAAEYNILDVDTQVEIAKNVPPLTAGQRDIFLLTERMNHRGVQIDLDLCNAAVRMHEAEKIRLNKKAQRMAKGHFEKLTQNAKVLEWINDNGYAMDDLQAKTIRRILAEGKAPRPVLRMLEYRAAAAKASIGKFKAAIEKTSSTGRIHEVLMYYGAKTGRWSGLGLQFQNLVRPKLPGWTDYDYLCELIIAEDLEAIECLYGDVSEALSSAVRSMIIPAPGNIIHCADYSAIEARIVLWLAGEETALEIFRTGGDIYKDMAATIYNKPVSAITGDERFVGKQAILGLGYQMGPDKFVGQVYDQSDILFELAFAKKVVTAYRTKYKKVKQLWERFNEAALQAMAGKTTSVGPVKFRREGYYLYMRLPSGRKIAYPAAKISKGNYGKPSVHYKVWRNNKWVSDSMYGGKWVENAVQGIAADIMGHGLLNADNNGYPVILSVHDEGLSETKENFGSIKEYEEILCDTPDWAKGCPVTAEGWSGYRYRK